MIHPVRFLLLPAALAACALPGRPPSSGASAEVAASVPADWRHPIDAAPAVGRNGMVATDEELATRVGIDVLRSGGTAVDAAVATAFALAVTLPSAGNIGGGGFIVVRMPDGTTAALDFREAAPAAATRNMYLDEQGEPTEGSLLGHLASGVPGSVAGLWEAHQRFGTKPWAELVEPAIRLAEDGFVVREGLARGIAGQARRFRQFEGSAALFLPNDEPIQAGSIWKNPDLAAVLKRIAERGPAGFYEGETADLIVAEMRRGGGIITHDDLRNYRAKWREPVEFTYAGHRVISMPPPSSGGITIALMAKMLEPYRLGSLDWHSADAVHLTGEAMKRAFADRNHYLGDPDFVNVPRAMLLSDAHIASRRASIRLGRATPSAEVTPGLGADREGTHTTHFSVVDGQGGAVALTTTINTGYGSRVVVSGAGFLLNNEMDDFAAKPGSPNGFGLVQGEANAIEPGKRMLSSMTPTIVLGPDGQPVLVTGASGGPRIISAVWQIVSNVVDYGMDVNAAVSAPRVHHQHLPDVLTLESDGFAPDLVVALRARGHEVRTGGGVGVGASIVRRAGAWHGMADPRASAGFALGY